MIRRFGPTFAATAVALSLAATAGAQEKRRRPAPPTRPAPPSQPDHAPHTTLRVAGFSPESGRPGAHVTIKGAGFTRSTSVLVDGRAARVVSWNPREIVFEMPAIAGDVQIALRKPGRDDLAVGSFRLGVAPVIRRMSPTSGPPGERVELSGRGFDRSDVLTMAGRSLSVAEWTPERLVVVIPDGTRSDYIQLSRSSGERARSPQRFRVLPQRPVIARFSPEGGPPGTRVRIAGSGFGPTDRVSYGSLPTPVLGRGTGWVDVAVPLRAPRSYHFQVRGPAGAGKSARPFALDLPPVATGFSPRRGAPGTEVTVRGKNFRDGDWVSLAGVRLPVVRVAPRRIGVTIPVGARTGEIAVGRDRHETPPLGRFEVFYPPTLTAFTPTRGEPGTRVTINGTDLAGAEVHYGRERLPVRSRSGDTSLVVEIPRAARDERFRVTTRAGSAQSPQVFQVQYYTVIVDARPRAGVPGTRIVLRGRHVDKADDFFIGSTRLELVARDNSTATCRVPEAARSAPIAWTSFGRRDQSDWRFEVLSAPVISQFQPTSGPAGTEIIIRGDHIDRGTEAFFGRRKLRVVRVRGPHEIAVQLPRNAAGTDYLYLEGRGARARSEQTFEVKVAPVITAAEPSSARPGQQVLVRGRWFTDATEILIGKVRSRVLRRDQRGGSILIEVPRDVPPGPHTLSARSEAMVSEHSRPFLVLAGSRRAPVRDHRGEKAGN